MCRCVCRHAHCVRVLITHISSVVTLSISSAELLPRVGDQISSLLCLRIGGGGGGGVFRALVGGSNQWPPDPKN